MSRDASASKNMFVQIAKCVCLKIQNAFVSNCDELICLKLQHVFCISCTVFLTLQKLFVSNRKVYLTQFAKCICLKSIYLKMAKCIGFKQNEIEAG